MAIRSTLMNQMPTDVAAWHGSHHAIPFSQPPPLRSRDSYEFASALAKIFERSHWLKRDVSHMFCDCASGSQYAESARCCKRDIEQRMNCDGVDQQKKNDKPISYDHVLPVEFYPATLLTA